MFEFPSDYISPLVDQYWEVSMGLNPFRETWVHNGFTCWSYSHWFLEFTISTVSHPSNFGFESFQVTFLFLQILFRNKHREIYIINSSLFELLIQMTLYLFPYEIRILFQYITSRDIIIVYQISFYYYLSIPLRKLLLFISCYFQQSLSFNLILFLFICLYLTLALFII